MKKMNVYTWLFVALLSLLILLTLVWGGPFLLLPMAWRLGIGLSALTILTALGVSSKWS